VGGAEALRGGLRQEDLLADTIEGRDAEFFAGRTADR
jgi:hypothetical protein